MSSTPRLHLPFLVPGQAQKEVTINEALQRLDILIQAGVEEGPRNSPPTLPQSGSCYLVGSSPAGEWSEVPGAIANWSEGGWRFIVPFDGLKVAIRGSGESACYRAGEWHIGVVHASEIKVAGERVVSTQKAGIADPQGGSVVDGESRAAIGAILTALRHHGLIASE